MWPWRAAKQQRRHAALGVDQLVAREVAIHARRRWSAVAAGGSCRCVRRPPPSRPRRPASWAAPGCRTARRRTRCDRGRAGRAGSRWPPGRRRASASTGDHGGAVGGRREHRRGQSARRLAGVEVGLAGDQQSRPTRRSPEAAANISAVVPLSVVALASAPPVEQRPRRRRVAVLGGQQQRRVGADAGRGLRVGAGVQQHRGQGRLVVHRRPVQRRHAVALRRVDVGRLLVSSAVDGRGVAALGGIGDRRVERGRHQSRSREARRVRRRGAPCRAWVGPWPQLLRGGGRGRAAARQSRASPVLSPKLVMSSKPERVHHRQHGVGHRRAVGGLARCSPPFSRPPAWPARNSGQRLWLWTCESPIGDP